MARESAILAYSPSVKPCVTPHGPLPYVSQVNAALVNKRAYIQDVLVQLGMVPSGVGSGDGQLCLGAGKDNILLIFVLC